MIDTKWNGLCDFVVSYHPPSENHAKVIGKLGLWDGHEIGFMLNRDYWGKGLMKEAMKTFLEEVWRTIELEDIIADVDPRNEASVGMLKKFGFEEAGYRENTFETHLGWCDSLDLKLNRPKEENAE